MEPITMLLLAAAGGGGYLLWKNNHQATENAKASVPPLPPQGLTYDPGMSSNTQDIVNQAMLTENDPVNLRNLATILRSKGYNNSAAALEAKAAATQLTGGKSVLPPQTPNTVLVQQPTADLGQIVQQLSTVIPQGISITPEGLISLSHSVIDTPDQTSTMSTIQTQRALNLLGIPGQDGYPLKEDGLMGPNTDYAIRTFQAEAGMVPDGHPTPHMYGVIRAALSSMNQSV
jgi:peptidoglycan hydrolase-like protein with peptidoglycan-binding domain